MNLAFFNNFWNNHKFRQHFLKWFWWHRYWVAILIYFDWRSFFCLNWFVFEQFIGYTLSWLQYFVNDKFVLRVGESKVNMGLSSIIKMSLVIVFFSNRLFWLYHLADINGGCFSTNLQVVIQILELVTQIAGLVNKSIKCVDLFGPLVCFILRYFLKALLL